MANSSKTWWGVRLGAFLFVGFLGFEAHAAEITLNDYTEINSKILCPIAAAMFWVLIAISSIMVLVAAYMYVTAGGDSEKVSKAHKTILYAAIGVAAALLAKAFPVVIASIFGVGDVNGC